MTPNIWDPNTSILSKEFISTFQKGVEAAHLANTELNVLVDMISYRLPLSGNSESNSKTINNYLQQKKYLLQGYVPFTQEQTTEPQQQPSTPTDEDVEAFVQQLVERKENAAALKDFATPEYVWMHRYTAETFATLTSELKKQYPKPEDQAKAKTVLLNKIKEISPDISPEGERWGQMLKFINLNIPYTYTAPIEKEAPLEEQAQEPQQEPYSAEATKGKQPSQPDKDIMADVEQFVEQLVSAHRTAIENFIKLESFNDQNTFEVFAPITSALKQQYPDIEMQKKLKPFIVATLNKMFPDMIGDLKMGSIHKVLNNNLPK